MLSWVIRGARVFDGSGGPAELADVGLAGGRIVRVGAVDAAELPDAARIFDATGLCLAPGFIDAHSHSDLTLPVHGRAESSLLQGITTEVAGSCGWSLAPVKAETRRAVLQRLLLSLCGIEPGQVDWTWHSFGEYAAHLAQLGTGTNLYPVLGQSMLRAHVVGLQARDATSEETEAMRAMLRQAIAEGCRGLSTGRSYMPGGHAKTAEIVALASELAASGGIYTSHIKNESDAMLDAVREVIEIGRRAGVKVQISHHKAIGPAHFGLVRQSLDLISQAHEQGLDINCDVYPYDFAQVFMMRDGLARSWRSLSAAAYTARLADPAARARLHARLARAKGSLVAAPDNYLLVSADGRPDAAGLSLGEAAARDGQEVFDWCCDLLSATACQVRIAARMDEADVRTVLAHPLTMPGTDAFAIDGVPPAGLPLHPRHYGTFPRVIGHYARDVGLFGLAEAVYKCTGLPAAKLGLADRGRVAEGAWADLVVFDQAGVADRATAAEPALHPAGLAGVWVNGQLAVRAGICTGARAGQVLLGG